MRPITLILLACLVPASAFCAEDAGERTYPADDRYACMDREADSARGGCITREDGSARSMPPQALPPEPDTARQSPPDSTISERGELPGTSSDR